MSGYTTSTLFFMKPHVLLFALWASVSLCFSQNLSPIAAFHFDGDFNEQVSGTQADTAGLWYSFVTDPSGAQTSALKIDAGGVIFPNALFAVMDSLDHSIAFWARKDGNSLWPAKGIFSGPGYYFRYNGVFHVLEFRFSPHPDSAVILPSVTMPDNSWNHYVISLDRDDSLKYYVDGRLRASRDISVYDHQRILAANPTLTMGRKDVSFDEILFFDKALTKEDVEELFQSGLTSIQQSPAQVISVSPNPATETLSINIPESGLMRVSISDISGRVVRSSILEETHIDIGSLSSGSYFLQLISSKGQRYTARFQKQ